MTGKKSNTQQFNIFQGKGQVNLLNAVKISFRRALTDKFRIIFGVVWIFFFALIASLWSKSIPYGLMSSFLVGFFITFCSVIPWRIRFFSFKNNSFIKIIIFNGILAFILGILFYCFSIILSAELFLSKSALKWVYGQPMFYAAMGLIFPIIGIGILFGEEQTSRERYQHAREKRMRKLEEEARIMALRAQINPHFFFNALNTIAALIPANPKDAERAVELLAVTLRPALTGNQPSLATLQSEIEIASSYTEIEKLRLGKRINIEFNILGETEDFLIPSLSLQPLIENTIKHGANKTPESYKILLKAFYEDNSKNLSIEIFNSPEKDFEKLNPDKMSEIQIKSGHALHNISTRLKLLFGDNCKFTAKMSDNFSGYIKMLVPNRKI